MYLSKRVLEHLRSVLPAEDERYRLIEPIGRGGAATVYLADDTRLGRRVALKILHQPGLESESRILAQLEHPGIVPVYDSGVLGDGRGFYAMKLVEGERLDAYIGRPSPLADRLRIFEKICEPVAFAHSRGVMHRDLKPANIMIGSFGEVLVLDWGAPGVLGTEGFMAPEQRQGSSGPGADIYALGRILTMVAGPAPKPVRAIAAKATASDPGQRYHDVSGLMADVAKFLAGEPVSAYRENAFEWAGRQFARHRVLIGLIAAYLLMRAMLIFFTGT